MNRMPTRESISIVCLVVVREASIATTELQENRRRTGDPGFHRATQFGLVSCTDAGRAVPNHLCVVLLPVEDEADVQVRGGVSMKFRHMDCGAARATHKSFLNCPPIFKTVQRLGDQMPSPIE
jgi:hypothetical protein